MKISYTYFRIFIHLLVAFVFLSELFKAQLPERFYKYLQDNKDIIFGFYYVYLAYEIYANIEIIKPISSRRKIIID
jgi:hypothetical protein